MNLFDIFCLAMAFVFFRIGGIFPALGWCFGLAISKFIL